MYWDIEKCLTEMTFDTHLIFYLIYLADFHTKMGALVFRAYNKTFYKMRILHTQALNKVFTFLGTWIPLHMRSIWAFEYKCSINILISCSFYGHCIVLSFCSLFFPLPIQRMKQRRCKCNKTSVFVEKRVQSKPCLLWFSL